MATKHILRRHDDEQSDFNEAVQNLLRGAYQEWPNEAGFEGLEEERGPIEIPVTGTIPPWAVGSLYRTGPGQSKIEKTPGGRTHHISHWFDGLAHTHRFDILPVDSAPSPDSTIGEAAATTRVKVLYSSRRQSDKLVKHIQEHGAAKFMSFGQKQDPCIGLLGKFMTTFFSLAGRKSVEGTDGELENVCVAVHAEIPGLPSKKEPSQGVPATPQGHRVGIPRTTWLTTDTRFMKQLDPNTLEPIGYALQQELHPDLKGNLSCAHAQRDPITGDLFNFNLEFSRGGTYRVFRVSAITGKADILATIRNPQAPAAYIHSFFLSQNFVILCIPSSHFSLGGAKMLWTRNLLDSIEPFNESTKCRWFIVDRHHGKGVVAELESEARFFFHTINAYEEQENGCLSIYCDVIEYPNFDIIRTFYYDAILDRNGAAKEYLGAPSKAPSVMPRLSRYKLHVESSGVVSSSPAQAEREFTILGPHTGDLPTINRAFATQRHRYVYALATRGFSTVVDTIVKTDTVTREAMYWNNPKGHTPGEAIYVARPGAAAEDDGILMSLVLDGHKGTSYLLCLNAQTMEETGRAEIGFAVAMGFHGAHYS